MNQARRLIGYLWRCDDPTCNCTQPVIEEHSINPTSVYTKVEKTKEVERNWEGTFLSDPSPAEEEILLDELAGECRRHRMVEDHLEPGRWERDI